MAIPKINHEYEAKKDQAKKLIAAGGCHAIQFWSRTDAQRLCPEGYEDFPPIEAPIYSSEWVEAAKKAIQLIRTGLQILEPPPASAVEEAARLYPFLDRDKFRTEKEYVYALSVASLQRQAHITCARMYTGEIEKLKAEVEHWKDEFESVALTLRALRRENDWIKIEDFSLANLPDYDELVLWRDERGLFFVEMLDKDGNPWLEKPYKVTHWKKIVHPKE